MSSIPGIRTVPGRVGLSLNGSVSTTTFQCHPGGKSEAAVLFSLAALGMMANLLLMLLILTKRHLRRWSQGLLFHQGLVDCARAAILVPLGVSVLRCQSLRRCSLLETTFVLLVTVSTINMLTTVLNDAPLIPNEEDNPLPLLMDSPHCVIFGMGMIWFAGLTINLGPTFLTGALAVSQDLLDACPLVYGPMRHHVLNILWILINLLCVALTFFHLRKLYRDFTRRARLAEVDRAASLVTALVSVQCDSAAPGGSSEDGLAEHHRRVRGYVHRMEREGVERVKMFVITTVAYVLFWCPLFILTIADPTAKSYSLSYEVTLHVAFVHAIVNPTLLLVLHKGLRRAAADLLCCYCFCNPDNGQEGGHPHLGSLRHRHQGRHSSGNMEGFPPFAVGSDDDGGSPCQHYACAAAAINRNYM